MNVRPLTTADIPSSRALWFERFGDSESFLNWYYSERFLPASSFGLFENGILLSQAHCRPMQLLLGGTARKALMIGGVSTKDGFEKRGHMHAVLQAVEAYAKSDGFDFLFLATEHPPIYFSSGFTACAGALYVKGTGTLPAALHEVSEPGLTASLTDFYGTVSCRYAFAPVRTEAEMRSRCEELASDGAKLVLLKNGPALRGYAFYNPDSDACEEAFAVDDAAYLDLLALLPEGSEVLLPPGLPIKGETVPLCMWKPLSDAVRALLDPSAPAFCPETF